MPTPPPASMPTPDTRPHEPADYDAVADLYDRAFVDIRRRRDEWRWLSRRFDTFDHAKQRPRVLDIGCGNGALLRALQPRIDSGFGVDVSARFIELARHHASASPQLRFQQIRDAYLPVEDHSIDLVISFLSFRYLDWDAVLHEVQRVLADNGRLWVIDMVAQRATPRDVLVLMRSGLRHVVRPLRDRRFHHDIARLTAHPAWHQMLQRNPIRQAAQYRECFRRWFPGHTLDVLNTTLTKRVIAFDSGPIRRT